MENYAEIILCFIRPAATMSESPDGGYVEVVPYDFEDASDDPMILEHRLRAESQQQQNEAKHRRSSRWNIPIDFVVVAIVGILILCLIAWGIWRYSKESFEGGQGYGWTHADYLYSHAPQRPNGCLSGPAAAWYACNARCAENPMGLSNSQCMDACLEARGRGEELAASPPDGCVGGRCQA